MGLMYVFPVNTDEVDRVEILSSPTGTTPTLVLKSYGLPMVFWSYLAASLIVIGTMWLAGKAAIHKLISYPDATLRALGFLVEYTLILTPLFLLALYFYEKQLRKNKTSLTLVYKVFFIPIWFKKILLQSPDSFSVAHFMDSPNMAKIYNKAELKAFENKGYFELHATDISGKNVLIDRHSRKADLVKMMVLLSRF
jgi:hypothetical protein